jgi:hypothetical protein
MSASDNGPVSIQEALRLARGRGYAISRDQFRRWAGEGLLGDPLSRKGRGRGAGRDVARFDASVVDRLAVIGKFAGLEVGRQTKLKVPMRHRVWRLLALGFSLPESVLRQALVTAAHDFERKRSSQGVKPPAIIEAAIHGLSRLSPTSPIRPLRDQLNKRGRYPVDRVGRAFQALAHVLIGDFEGFMGSSAREAVAAMFSLDSAKLASEMNAFFKGTMFERVASDSSYTGLLGAVEMIKRLPLILDPGNEIIQSSGITAATARALRNTLLGDPDVDMIGVLLVATLLPLDELENFYAECQASG